jgi:hypothetical protein
MSSVSRVARVLPLLWAVTTTEHASDGVYHSVDTNESGSRSDSRNEVCAERLKIVGSPCRPFFSRAGELGSVRAHALPQACEKH